MNVLREHRRTQLEQRLAFADYQDHGLVFAAVNGRPIDPSNLRRAWRSTLAASGIGKHLRWHDLRHVHASLMLIGGTHPAIVAERLGHSDVRVTLNTYTHVLPNLQVEAAAELDRWLMAGNG